jgi:hypothetical protein
MPSLKSCSVQIVRGHLVGASQSRNSKRCRRLAAVACGAGLIYSGITSATGVACRSGLVDPGVTTAVSCTSRLIESRVTHGASLRGTSAKASVARSTRLVDSGIDAAVSSRSRLVHAAIARL